MLGPGMPERSSVEPAPVADPHRATTSRERPKRVTRAQTRHPRTADRSARRKAKLQAKRRRQRARAAR